MSNHEDQNQPTYEAQQGASSSPPTPPFMPAYTAPAYPPAAPLPASIPLPPYRYPNQNTQYPPPQAWQRASRRPAGMLRGTPGRITLIASAVLLIALIGFAVLQRYHPQPDGYLWSNSAAVEFIQWTEDTNHHLSGTLQSVSATSDNTVKSTSAAFTGVRDGSSISITFSALGFSSTFAGTLDGAVLTLSVPDQNGLIATDVFHTATVQNYNDSVAALRQRVQQQAAATQSAQATVDTQQAQAQATQTAQSNLDQAVTSANNQLAGDLNILKSDVQSLAGSTSFSDALTAYTQDWARMQTDYQQEQTDYQQGCGTNGYNASVVAYDASVVNYDLGTIQYDDGTLTYDANSMNNTLQQVKNDIPTVQADWQNLKAAIAADTTGNVSAQYSQRDIDSAVGNAQKQVDASNKALSQAQNQAKQYDQEAAQTNTTAQQLANSMHC